MSALFPFLTKQARFFYDMTGDQNGEESRVRDAIKMAKAETWAVQEGYTFEEDIDEDGVQYEPTPDVVIYIAMLDEQGNVVQSLSGIGDPEPRYKRWVRAELALEQMHKVGA